MATTPAGASFSGRAQDNLPVPPELSQQLLGTLSACPPPTCQQADPDTTSLICYLIFGSYPGLTQLQTHGHSEMVGFNCGAHSQQSQWRTAVAKGVGEG